MSDAALFLDRDGVVNRDTTGYTHRIEDFQFIDGIFQLARAAVAAGYKLIVVTNQAGIGRGYYTEAQFQELTSWMKARFEREGAPITAVYHCPHHPTEGIGGYRKECECRKPQPGLLLQAQRNHGLDLTHSVLLGDKASDIEAGHRAGVGSTILLRQEPETANTSCAPCPTFVATSHEEVIRWLAAHRIPAGPTKTMPS